MKIRKYTWKMIRRDFSKVYPNLSKKSNYWCPYNFMSIKVYLNDGRTIIFDDSNKTAKFIEPWKDEIKNEEVNGRI